MCDTSRLTKEEILMTKYELNLSQSLLFLCDKGWIANNSCV